MYLSFHNPKVVTFLPLHQFFFTIMETDFDKFVSSIEHFDYHYDSDDDADGPPPSIPNPDYKGKKKAPSSSSDWISTKKPKNVSKPSFSTPRSTPGSKINRHHANSKIVPGSRVSRRIGEELDNDRTPTGRKRKAFVGGTVKESTAKHTWLVHFDNGTVSTCTSKQLTFVHNDYVKKNEVRIIYFIFIVNFIYIYCMTIPFNLS